MPNYPIKFKPILHEYIWGGNKLHRVLGKEKKEVLIGESWEISTVPGSVSVVVNGEFRGKSLQELINTYKADFLGEEVFEKYNTSFPLLIKFIDAKSNLSVQLHPNDTLAKKRHNSFGKEEMWYVMQVEKEGKLYFGFNKELSKAAYKKHLEAQTLPSVLQEELVKKGDVYHITTGRVHAIGSGVLLAEIQQSSDLTYRLYDWGRVDANGNSRELHTELALDAIDFKVPKSFKTNYKLDNDKSVALVESPFFTTNILKLTERVEKRQCKAHFRIYICVEGEAGFEVDETETTLTMGETLLIPASMPHFSIKPNQTAILLEIYVD